MATRGKPPGLPRSGGREKGRSVDREERKLITDKMAADLVFCYDKLGGRSWLLEYARANPKEFIQFGLSRLWPAPQKDDDPSIQVNTQINVDGMSEFEAARRVSYALAKALYADPSKAPLDAEQEYQKARREQLL